MTDAEVLRSIVRGDLAGSGDLLERRVDEILIMYAYLREHGTGERSDLLDTVDVDATGYAGRMIMWSNMVKGRDTLRALPGVRKPSDGRSVWKYDPDADWGGRIIPNDIADWRLKFDMMHFSQRLNQALGAEIQYQQTDDKRGRLGALAELEAVRDEIDTVLDEHREGGT